MVHFPLKRNNHILTYNIDYLKQEWKLFNQDDIDIINSMEVLWFKNFNWENINIIKENFWNSIAIQIIWFIQDFPLNTNIFVKTWLLSKDSLFEAYTFLFWKLLTRKDFNVNMKNFNNWTLLSHIIWFNEIDFLKFVLKVRDDLNINDFDSKYWKTYLDLAKWLWHFEIAKILEEKINKISIKNKTMFKKIPNYEVFKEIPNYEDYKNTILKLFYENKISKAKNICLDLLNREYYLDDINYDIFAKNFLWEIELENDNLEEAKNYFKDVFSKKINDNEIALDDLWIYFLQWNSYIKYKNIQNYQWKIERNEENIQEQFDTLNYFHFKWFQYFPKNEYDFKDDLNNHLRENIINKFFWLIQNTYNVLSSNIWSKENIFRLEKLKKDWKTINYRLHDKLLNQIVVRFWFKRPDFYWNNFEKVKEKIAIWKENKIDENRKKLFEEKLKKENNITKEINKTDVFKNYKEIEDKIFEYNKEEKEIINKKISKAYDFRENKEYLESLKVYKDLILKYPNDIGILHSLWKTLIVIWHFELAKKIFEREIMFEEIQRKEVFINSSRNYLEDLKHAIWNERKEKKLQKSIVIDFYFKPLSKITSEKFFATNIDFENEYEYLNYMFSKENLDLENFKPRKEEKENYQKNYSTISSNYNENNWKNKEDWFWYILRIQRASGKDFLLWGILFPIISFLIGIIIIVIISGNWWTENDSLAAIFILIFILILIFWVFSASILIKTIIKRYHDLNKSWWWSLIFIFFLNLFLIDFIRMVQFYNTYNSYSYKIMDLFLIKWIIAFYWIAYLLFKKSYNWEIRKELKEESIWLIVFISIVLIIWQFSAAFYK